jgi:hypothetical protein
MPDLENELVTTEALAAAVGLAPVTIRSYVAKRVIRSKGQRNKHLFPFGPAVRAIIEHLCAKPDDPAIADFHRERALKERANRKLREILVEQTASQLHPADLVRLVAQDSDEQVRLKLCAMVDELTAHVADQTEPLAVKKLMEESVRRTLVALKDYKPEDFYERHPEIVAELEGSEGEE